MKTKTITGTQSAVEFVGVLHLVDEVALPFLVTQMAGNWLDAPGEQDIPGDTLFDDPHAMRFATAEEATAAYQMRSTLAGKDWMVGDARLARLCTECRVGFCPRKDTTTICSNCHYNLMFTDIEEAYADVLAELRSLYVDKVTVQHTGGGCMAIQIDFDFGGYLWLTDNQGPLTDDRSEVTGWMVGAYNEDGDSIGLTDPNDEYSLLDGQDPSVAAAVAMVKRAVKILEDRRS